MGNAVILWRGGSWILEEGGEVAVSVQPARDDRLAALWGSREPL